MWPPLDALTTDGYDLQWGTNVLGHFYLGERLMPALVAGAQTSPDKHARVITTSSGGAYLGKLQYDTMRDGAARRKKTTEDLYFQSKLGNAVVAHQIAKRYADRGIVSISVNPGKDSLPHFALSDPDEVATHRQYPNQLTAERV